MSRPPTPAAAEPRFPTATFEAIGTTVSVTATVPAALEPAARLLRRRLAELDLAASRFRPDSELSRLNARSRAAEMTAVISPLLAHTLDTALRVAALTGGLVDPTVGVALESAGYDRDFDLIRPGPGSPQNALDRPAVGWSAVRLDVATRLLTVPAGIVLDVGSSAKAMAADDLAAELASLPGGFVVNLGGDIAVSGETPTDGWRLGIEDSTGEVLQRITSHGQAVATSSTRLRRWVGPDGDERHHIVDPRTGAVADPVWAQVTCCAASAVEANAASTAAIVLGEAAPGWLREAGLPSLLVHRDGRVLRVAGWPEPDDEAGAPVAGLAGVGSGAGR